MLPNLVAVAVFLAFPLIFSLYLSLTNWELLTPPTWAGLANYVDLFADPLFWTALWNTALFTIGSVVPIIVLSLLSALALNQKLFGIGFFRAVVFLPLVASTVAMAVIWMWLFNTDNGLLNWLLSLAGVEQIGWLTDPHWALISLIIVSVWKGVPLSTVILLAAVQNVPDRLYDAASLDGAGVVRKFFAITLPMIRPTIAFVLVISIIQSFQVFDLAYVMTNGSGGPGTSTYVLGIMVFQHAFRFYEMGYAAAIQWVVFLILLGLTYIQLRLSRSAEDDL
ncbi:MAG: sugar ABC transporter permease [Bifidobacteriaceae bacterium]|nr:sugar ABC transporter permease [Bifidobacteriaceae bacterium]